MLYKKPVLKPLSKENLAAFSLVEVLMTLLLIALVLISVAPIITKRSASRNIEGVVFTYKGNNVTQNNKCFLTSQLQYADAVGHSEWLSTDEMGFLTTKECTEYEFTPPSGVKTVNLTLVAGGGGGGGAAGGTLQEETIAVPTTEKTINYANRDEIKKIKIDYLVGHGEDGQEFVNSDNKENMKSYNLIYSLPKKDFYDRLGKYMGGYRYSQSTSIYTGMGGRPSSAIYNYNIPFDMFRFSHNNVIENGGSVKNKFSEESFSTDHKYAQYQLLNNENDAIFKYAATYCTDSLNFTDIACVKDGKNFMPKQKASGLWGLLKDSNYNNCGSLIQKENILSGFRNSATQDSVTSVDAPNDIMKFNQNYSFGLKKGGEGGVLPMYSNYGKGGRGQGTIANYKYCSEAEKGKNESGQEVDFSDHTGKERLASCDDIGKLTHDEKVSKYCINDKAECSGKIDGLLNEYCGQYVIDVKRFLCPVEKTTSGSWSGKKGGPYFAKTTYTIERPGGVGGGGSGAAYVQIKNFPVEEGVTYIIRVGKGGDGGQSGQYGYLNGATNNSTKGQNGTGGVTSSIWKRQNNTETLLYMISGGAGGQGGQIYGKNQAGNVIINNIPYVDDVDNNGSNSAYKKGKGNPGKIVPVLFYSGNEPTNNSFGTNKISILNNSDLCKSEVNFFGNTGLVNMPSVCLSYSEFGLSANTKYTYLNTNLSLGNLFKSQYNLSGFSNFNTAANTVSINGINYLTSYYYRTLAGNQIGYVGGLGGFSGLGGKAGCGGLFIGNPNGFNGNNADPKYNSAGAKKIFLSGSVIAEISDYYENCTIDTPDGQSATFVAPSPQKRNFGQAGAGGGGGGYKMFYGGGNGGRGQDGYVMIDWRK